MNAVLAITWKPELRGIIVVLIAVAVLCGSIYVILSTNLGARLGFLVAFAALSGWLFIMGCVWWSYGKGLLGPDASWQPVSGRTVLQDPLVLSEVGVLDAPVKVGPDASPTAVATAVQEKFVADGWKQLDPAQPKYQQAAAAGGVMLEDAKALASGEFAVVNVYDKGGERTPVFWDNRIDFSAFFHKPHFAVVEVAPLVIQRAEPGRAPATPVIDTTRPHQYVYMVRDLGAKRQPAGFITIGSLIVFLTMCYLLHSRDRRVTANRAAKALPAKA